MVGVLGKGVFVRIEELAACYSHTDEQTRDTPKQTQSVAKLREKRCVYATCPGYASYVLREAPEYLASRLALGGSWAACR